MSKRAPLPWALLDHPDLVVLCQTAEYASKGRYKDDAVIRGCTEESISAAAPDLLKAIEALANAEPHMSCANIKHRKTDAHKSGEPCPALERYRSAWNAVLDAIAKAQGEAE